MMINTTLGEYKYSTPNSSPVYTAGVDGEGKIVFQEPPALDH